ncbi:thioredoxin family protein [soil metagenome]
MKSNTVVYSILFLLFGLAAFVYGTGVIKKQAQLSAPISASGFAVVELFTSEGCSSCPPADAAVEKIAKLYPGNTFVLGFHVDYWNRLGWRDVFSDAAYSDRQREYVDHFKLGGAYTPQVVVNGASEFVGSDITKLKAAVEKGINKEVSEMVKLTEVASNGKEVRVDYKCASNNNVVLNLALVQNETNTNVQRGENGGRVLHHINIVRDFKIIHKNLNSGNAILSIPNGLKAVDCKIIAYLQNSNTWQIMGVATAEIK